MAERRRAWGWRMWSGGGEKQPPLRETSLLGGRYVHQDEKAIAEKAYPASYNVLLTRLATMVLLTVFVSAATLLTFFFMRTSSVNTVTTLGYGLRRELLNRAADQVVSLLDSQARCSVQLARTMDRIWLFSPRDYENLTATDDDIVAHYFLSCKDITGSGFCAANGIYRYDYVNNDPTDPARNTTCLSIFSNATSPAHVAPITYADVLDLQNGFPVRPATVFPTRNDCREKPYYLGAKASPTGKSLTLINAVVGGPTLVAAHVIGNGEKGVVTMTMVLTAVSDFLATLDLQDGTMYITAGTVLVASSDGYLGHSGNASGLLQPSDSSNPHIRASAQYLGANLGNSSAHDVRLLGVKYFMDTQVVQYDDLEFTIVMLVPRRAIMRDIDRKSRLTIAIIVSGTAGIGVIGCFFVILLTSPVSEEIKLKRELILQLEATQKAEARNETKSRFLANMSHELRSPMASIIGLLDLLLDDDLTSPQRGNIMQIRECAAGLLGLLNDLLDISKIEAGKMTLESTDFDIVGLMENLVDIMSVQSVKKGVELALDLPDGIFGRIVYGDPARVRQVFTNLINNAIKFTADGYVLVRCRPDETKAGWVIFDVEDTGCGIPKDRVFSVFESFVQADQSTTRLYGGTGLGLTIVKSLVELMGGTIKIEEKATPGSLFRVRLFFQGEEGVASPTTNGGNRSEDVSDQMPADVSPRSPPRGVPRVLNLAEAVLKVPGSYRRPSRTQTLNYLDLDKMGRGADVDRLCDEIAERRARARRSERRMSPLGGARAELRTGDALTVTVEGRALLARVQTSDGVVTVPAAASGGVTEGTPGPPPSVARSLTAPLVRGQTADTMLSNFKAFCRRLSGTSDQGKVTAVTSPQWVKLTKPSPDPFVRASVLLAIKGTANQEIAARFLQERGMLVTRARDWSSALALLKKDHRNSSASYPDRASDSKRSSERSSGEDRKENYDGDVSEGFVKANKPELDTLPRARSRLLLEHIAEGAAAKEDLVLKQLKSGKGWDVRDLSRRMRSFSLRRASKDFKQVSTLEAESAPPEVSKSKEAGRCFSLVLLDAALMPCALSDAESVDRCLKEVHRILGREAESADLKQTNVAGKTESFSLQAGSSFENKPGTTRSTEMPHLVWLLGNETPAIMRRLLRSARLNSIMQKPVFISRLRTLLDGLASATSQSSNTPSEPPTEERAVSSQSSSTPSEPPTEERAVSSQNLAKLTPENSLADLCVAIPEKPSFEEIVTSPTSEKAPSNGTPTSTASPRSPVYLTPAAQEAMELFRIANYKVLVAEDTPILRQLARAMLTKMNASVTAVENGQEAVVAVEAANFGEGEGDRNPGGERRPFDFVLMDCQMPVMDGYAAVRAIRTLEADRNVSRRLPIFALTAHAMAEDEAKCLEAGMDRYLTKPLERGKLAEAIRTVLQD